MKIELITIGNELLSGKTIDANSAYISEQLNLAGLQVSRITSVSDSHDEIVNIFQESEQRADIILMTGGLGPTSDDVTKPALYKFFDTKPVFRKKVFEHIESLLKKKNISVNEKNKNQAVIPESAIILDNDLGTAPGMWFNKQGKIFICLPGVPFEMKALLLLKVIPKLRTVHTFPAIFHKTVVTQGSFEAELAEKLKVFEEEMPEDIKIAYLPSPGIIRLRLTAAGQNYNKLESEVEKQVKKLQIIIPEYIIGFNEDTIESVISQLLQSRNQNIAVAESCTGGYISSMLTSISGSSQYFKGAIVAYSNEIKRDQLAIDPEVIEEHGAVSERVAEDMAVNTRLLFNSDYAVAVTGIAGPGGGTDEKPVGTTWVAVSTVNSITSEKFIFGDNRGRNIRRASVTALNMLRKQILKE